MEQKSNSDGLRVRVADRCLCDRIREAQSSLKTQNKWAGRSEKCVFGQYATDGLSRCDSATDTHKTLHR